MEVTIDPNSGFCFGVKHTIDKADQYLEEFGNLDCLGEIVHNEAEMSRLAGKGLNVIDNAEFAKLKNEKVLVRAHGEPPSTYDKAKENNIELLDTTCPIVLKLQNKIKKSGIEMKSVGGNVVIYGKKLHPEVIGLLGNSNETAIVIENVDDLDKLDFAKPIHLYSQTTMSSESYREITDLISKNYSGEPVNFKSHKSVCGQVSNRVPDLKEFAKQYDIVLFVSGVNSSNGHFLFGVCQRVNPNSYKISSANELEEKWFKKGCKVGISGATSTPHWLMKQVVEKIKRF